VRPGAEGDVPVVLAVEVEGSGAANSASSRSAEAQYMMTRSPLLPVHPDPIYAAVH
jgi:hypothetical protein